MRAFILKTEKRAQIWVMIPSIYFHLYSVSKITRKPFTVHGMGDQAWPGEINLSKITLLRGFNHEDDIG